MLAGDDVVDLEGRARSDLGQPEIFTPTPRPAPYEPYQSGVHRLGVLLQGSSGLGVHEIDQEADP